VTWKSIIEPNRPHIMVWRMRISCWTRKAENTHRICNVFYFSTVTVVTRKRFIVTLYVHYLFLHISIGEKCAELLKGICKLWLWNRIYTGTVCCGLKCSKTHRDTEFFPIAFSYINFNLNLIYFWRWIACEPSDDICKSPSALAYRQCFAFVSGKHIVRM
jgi:hypothetical protein